MFPMFLHKENSHQGFFSRYWENFAKLSYWYVIYSYSKYDLMQSRLILKIVCLWRCNDILLGYIKSQAASCRVQRFVSHKLRTWFPGSTQLQVYRWSYNKAIILLNIMGHALSSIACFHHRQSWTLFHQWGQPNYLSDNNAFSDNFLIL